MTEEDTSKAVQFEQQMLKAIFGLLAAAIIGGVGWMWSIDRTVTTLTQQMTQLATQADLRNDRISALDTRLRATENMASAQRSDLLAIRDALGRIDERLNRVLDALDVEK